jgi:P4 family phage/plasmid primase-like protien
MELEDVPKYFNNEQNIGILLGEPSGGLIDVDLDTPEAVAAGRYLLPDTLRSGRERSPNSHYWYRCDPIPSTAKFQIPRSGEGPEMFVELRSTGKQTVVAPSVHPDGDQYTWGSGETAELSGPELLQRVREVATAALLARHWPMRGRHEITLAAAGYLGRRLAPERVEAILEAAAAAAGDEEERDRQRAVQDTLEGLQAGRPMTGGPALDQLAPGIPEILTKWWGWRREPTSIIHNTGKAESFNLTDLGNAGRMVAHHGDDIRYCYPWGVWLIWDGRRWAIDETGEIHRRAKQTVKGIYREASGAGDDETRKALAKHAMRSEAENRMQAMISLAKSEVPIMPQALDASPWLLNTANGTVNLKTGELQDHRREDLITKIAPVEYEPEAEAPTWTATLERAIPQPAVRAFFKKLCGYAISGDVSEHVLPVLYGTGANGKSTILNALLEAAGEYGMQAAPDLLIAKRGGHPTEVADLFGMRLVASIEVEDGRRLAEALVKSLTGGDKVRARRMRQDFWEFPPTHTAFLCTNHKPEVRGTDNAIWRRIRLIPFTETIPPAEQDKKLPERLRDELPGILAWTVEGCLEWQREGLTAPDEVRKATGAYRSEMDVIGAFLRDECEVGKDYSATFKEVFTRYEEWCEEAGEKPETRRKFNARLKERGPFTDRRSGPGGAYEWHGLKLLKK